MAREHPVDGGGRYRAAGGSLHGLMNVPEFQNRIRPDLSAQPVQQFAFGVTGQHFVSPAATARSLECFCAFPPARRLHAACGEQ